MQSYSTLGGWNQLINAATDLQEEALTFAQFMTATAQEKQLTIDGGLRPTRKALYEDPDVIEALPGIELQKEIIFDNAKSRPVTEFYSEMSAAMAEQFNLCLMGQVSPTEAAETLQTSLSNIV